MLNWMSKVEKGRAGLARNREKLRKGACWHFCGQKAFTFTIEIMVRTFTRIFFIILPQLLNVWWLVIGIIPDLGLIELSYDFICWKCRGGGRSDYRQSDWERGTDRDRLPTCFSARDVTCNSQNCWIFRRIRKFSYLWKWICFPISEYFSWKNLNWNVFFL